LAAAPPGLGAVGGGALPPPGFGAGGLGARPGFAPTGGGLGLLATGGGGFEPIELAGREFTGVASEELPPVAGFFHGVFDPLAGAMPGNTDTGFADACAGTDLKDGGAAAAGLGAAGAGAGAGVGAGIGRRFGGGGGAAGAFGLGGTGSK